MGGHTTSVTVRQLDLPILLGLVNILLPVWSNFEIADLDFWRSEAYEKFFTHLDRNGGFYYEVPGASVRFGHIS